MINSEAFTHCYQSLAYVKNGREKLFYVILTNRNKYIFQSFWQILWYYLPYLEMLKTVYSKVLILQAVEFVIGQTSD